MVPPFPEAGYAADEKNRNEYALRQAGAETPLRVHYKRGDSRS